MKRVLVKSVFDTWDYVMGHYYPPGLEEFAERRDCYAVISIQDTQAGGFGFEFRENRFCKGVLTLYFDDVERKDAEGAAFTPEMAGKIIRFILDMKNKAETLIVHCYAGQSRSRAVGAFAVRLLGGDNSSYFKTGTPNRLVYETLLEAEKRTGN